MILSNLGRRLLWQRARDYLRRYQPVVIGIIGSNGKTMAKDAIALALKDDRLVRYSPQSYNTRLGVALTILGINQRAIAKQWWRLLIGSRLREMAGPDPNTIILELGAAVPGDIDYFARQLPFQIGVVTNVQAKHLDLFTSKELLAHEYTSLIVDLPRTGTAVLNGDDALVSAMARQSRAPVIFYGADPLGAVSLTRWHRLSNHHLICEVSIDRHRYEINLKHIVASYQLANVLAALAVAKALNVNLARACQNLTELKPAPGCQRLLAGIKNSSILDDSFQTTPESAIQALDLLNSLASRRRIAVLGDMPGLAAEAKHYHALVVQHAAKSADILVGIGESMKQALLTAPQVGSARHSLDVHHFESLSDAAPWLVSIIRDGDLVLVKGSRAMQLEQLVHRLLADPVRDRFQVLPQR